mmetsp:Transcript_45110/g.88255  ORF Transcript_45110/g.88255 Transcript_45110/m.88255 type:complete len:155 (-) Transcript_45110:153-617(-)
MNLYYLRDKDDALVLPETKLFYRVPPEDPQRKSCRQPRPLYVNETDNSLLCKKYVIVESDFPFSQQESPSDSESASREIIPIFWSGSSSFQTFLNVDFFNDRIVVDAMTTVTSGEASEGARRYADTQDLPNAVYPYHDKSDFEEIVILLNDIPS